MFNYRSLTSVQQYICTKVENVNKIVQVMSRCGSIDNYYEIGMNVYFEQHLLFTTVHLHVSGTYDF